MYDKELIVFDYKRPAKTLADATSGPNTKKCKRKSRFVYKNVFLLRGHWSGNKR